MLLLKKEDERMHFTVSERKIKCDDANIKLIGDNADYTASFTFDEEWEDQIKTARFQLKNKYADVILEDNACTIPASILKQGILEIGVYTEKITSMTCEIQVMASIKEKAGNVAAPAYDVYIQILNKLKEQESGGISDERLMQAVNNAIADNEVLKNAMNSLTNPFETAYWKSSDGNIYLVSIVDGALSVKKEGDNTGGGSGSEDGDNTGDEGGSSEGDNAGGESGSGEEDNTGGESGSGEGDNTGDEGGSSEGDNTEGGSSSGEENETGGEDNPPVLEDLLEDRLLIWHDEFEGDSLNTDVWNYEIGYKRNNEPQYYQEQNVEVSNSICKITARKETVTDETSGKTYNWTSGSIKTNRNMCFQYGRVEAKIKVSGVGCEFPAFWMIGMGLPWARSGEIDVMEMWDNDFNNATFNLHWANNEGLHKSVGTTKYACTRDEWHIFAVEIDEQYITTYLDGVQVAQHDHTTDTYFYEQGYSSSALNPFKALDKYIILNLAMSYSKAIVGDSNRTMEIDWVRLYAAKTQTEAKEISDIKFLVNGRDSNYSSDGERSITLSSLKTYGSSKSYYAMLKVNLYDAEGNVIRTYPLKYSVTSSDPEVIEVGEGQLSLKLLKAGTADITVTLENGMSKTRKVTLS